MTRALATLLFLSVAAPAHGSYSIERPKSRVGGVSQNSAKPRCFVWLQAAETRQVIGVLAYDCASGKPENLYAYAAWDPVNNSDPFGLFIRSPELVALEKAGKAAPLLRFLMKEAPKDLAGGARFGLRLSLLPLLLFSKDTARPGDPEYLVPAATGDGDGSKPPAAQPPPPAPAEPAKNPEVPPPPAAGGGSEVPPVPPPVAAAGDEFGKEIDPNKTPVYRGGSSLQHSVDDIKIDKKTGLVKTTHGLSTDLVPKNVEQYGGAYRIKSIPDELKIVQRGQRITHYEIMPRQPMTQARYQELLDQIVLEGPKTAPAGLLFTPVGKGSGGSTCVKDLAGVCK